MSSIFFLIIVSLVVGLGGFFFFILSSKKHQFDDIEAPKYRMLNDDEDDEYIDERGKRK